MLLVANQTSLGFYYQFNVTDHLGSTRMSVTDTGSLTNLVRRDFLPYGEELTAGVGLRGTAGGYYGGNDPMRQKFTGYERDVETGLDYVKARYLSSTQGRFASVDPWLPVLGGSEELIAIYADQPQNWNRYNYVTNQPLGFIDPDGENPLIVAGAVAGAIIGGGSKYLEQKFSGDGKVDWGKVASGALNGAIQGGVAGATGGALFAVQLSAGVGASIAGGITEHAINSSGAKKEVLRPEEILKDAASGLLGGATSAAVVSVLNKSRVMSSLAEQALDAAFDALSAAYSLSRKYILRRTTIGNPSNVDRLSKFGQALPKQFMEQGYEKGWDYVIGSSVDWLFPAKDSTGVDIYFIGIIVKEDGSEEPWDFIK